MVLNLGGNRSAQARHAEPRGSSASRLLYQRVISHIEALVAERELAPGDLLPTYTELAEQTGVSLITVRRALDELERAGRVRRHQGLGTFLARPRIVAEPARAGSLLATLAENELRQPAGALTTRVLELRRGLPSPAVARALRIEEDSAVWLLRRQRCMSDQPVVLETAIIPATLAPGLDSLIQTAAGSLYDLLALEYGLEDSYEEQYLEVVSPSREERRLLALPPRSEVVRIRGLSLDKNGTPFDCFEQLYPAADFAFAIAGSTSRHLFPAPSIQDWEVRPLPETAEQGEPAPARRRRRAPD
jgi:DNA-binding GntR family transcriptional regulator